MQRKREGSLAIVDVWNKCIRCAEVTDFRIDFITYEAILCKTLMTRQIYDDDRYKIIRLAWRRLQNEESQ